MADEERTGPPTGRPDTTSTTAIVSEPGTAERTRRRWILRQVGQGRRISVALDQLCGIEVRDPGTVQIDYAACGLDLGWPERRAAGLALLAQERAA